MDNFIISYGEEENESVKLYSAVTVVIAAVDNVEEFKKTEDKFKGTFREMCKKIKTDDEIGCFNNVMSYVEENL